MDYLLAIIVGGIVAVFLLTVFRGAPYVPTHRSQIERAFKELYPITKDDFLVDIGSGDGVVLRAVAAAGGRGIGYEINPLLVVVSRFLSRSYKHQVRIKLADFWFAKLPPETTIVYTFGESRDIHRMYVKVQQEANRLQKPLYFMSYGFRIKDIKEVKADKSFGLYLVKPE